MKKFILALTILCSGIILAKEPKKLFEPNALKQTFIKEPRTRASSLKWKAAKFLGAAAPSSLTFLGGTAGLLFILIYLHNDSAKVIERYYKKEELDLTEPLREVKKLVDLSNTEIILSYIFSLAFPIICLVSKSIFTTIYNKLDKALISYFRAYLLNNLIKNWPENKDKIPAKYHKQFEELHKQHEQDPKSIKLGQLLEALKSNI